MVTGHRRPDHQPARDLDHRRCSRAAGCGRSDHGHRQPIPRWTPARAGATADCGALDRPRDWVVPQAADVRELVVLLENGGIDLGLRGLVDAVVVDLLPGASLVVSDEVRGAMAARCASG